MTETLLVIPDAIRANAGTWIFDSSTGLITRENGKVFLEITMIPRAVYTDGTPFVKWRYIDSDKIETDQGVKITPTVTISDRNAKVRVEIPKSIIGQQLKYLVNASGNKLWYVSIQYGSSFINFSIEFGSGVLIKPEFFNTSPSLTLTSPANNQTLVEGNTYTIAGTATDADSGNVVTVKYKIDNGTTYNLTASVSDGTTPINFSKTLTYLNNRLYDGQNPVTPILDENVTHTLTVWAEDDQGGKSPDTTRNFTVLYNQPPQISGSDQDLGSITAPPSIQYTVTDLEHYAFTITEKVGDVTIRSFAGTDGQQETLTIPDDIWITLQPDVTHNLTITATDQYGASSTRTYTFKRTVDGIELETITPLPADAQPYRMVLTLNAQYPQNAVVNVQVCNNGYDANPTWEDATSAVLNGRPYVFTNTTKTALDWGIRIKISILPGA